MRFAAMPVANITSGKFNQSDGSVTLYWTADNSNFQQGNWGTKWVIYRDGVKIGTVKRISFIATEYENYDPDHGRAIWVGLAVDPLVNAVTLFYLNGREIL